jgi:hypothetical protein
VRHALPIFILPLLILPVLTRLFTKACRLARRPVSGGTFSFPEITMWACAFRPIARRYGSLDTAAHGRSVAEKSAIVTAKSV